MTTTKKTTEKPARDIFTFALTASLIPILIALGTCIAH